MDELYLEKIITKTSDKKKGKSYVYGTINIRNKSLSPLIGQRVRIMIKPIGDKSATWDVFVTNRKK